MKRRHLQGCSACNGGVGGCGAKGLVSALSAAPVEREEVFFPPGGAICPQFSMICTEGQLSVAGVGLLSAPSQVL